ncbi:MAG TPA: hypothetical protein VFV08_01185 [Puia sp.]|nr:hypothetical protein [Puia sp.]
MDSKIKKDKLLIQGNFSEEELEEVKREIGTEDFEITKYVSLHIYNKLPGNEDFLNLIFNDFHITTFLRDYLFGECLAAIIKGIQKVSSFLIHKKKKQINNITVFLEVEKSDKTTVFVNVRAKFDKIDLLIQEVNTSISDNFFERIPIGKNVSITLDQRDNLKILVY